MSTNANIVNLTPHKITLVTPNGDPIISIEPSGIVARVSVKTEIYDSVQVGKLSIPLTHSVYGNVVDLPEPQENTIYIVSSLVAQRVRERTDVFIPNESVRDSQGRIIGCKSLARV